MGIIGTTVATGCGAYMVCLGAKNWYNGKDIGKIQVALGVIALAGGVYSFMNSGKAPEMDYCWGHKPDSNIDCKALLKEVEKSCARVLQKGYENIPGLDLEKHVETVGPNFSSGIGHPRCDTELTGEGKFFFYQSGLKDVRKYMYEAITEAGLKIHGVIRHYHSIKV